MRLGTIAYTLASSLCGDLKKNLNEIRVHEKFKVSIWNQPEHDQRVYNSSICTLNVSWRGQNTLHSGTSFILFSKEQECETSCFSELFPSTHQPLSHCFLQSTNSTNCVSTMSSNLEPLLSEASPKVLMEVVGLLPKARYSKGPFVQSTASLVLPGNEHSFVQFNTLQFVKLPIDYNDLHLNETISCVVILIDEINNTRLSSVPQ